MNNRILFDTKFLEQIFGSFVKKLKRVKIQT